MMLKSSATSTITPNYSKEVNNMFSIIDPETGLPPDTNKLRKEPWAKNIITGCLAFFGVDEDGYPIMLDNCGHYVYAPEGRLYILGGANNK